MRATPRVVAVWNVRAVGDLGGQRTAAICASCGDDVYLQTWRGDRLAPFQLCDPCRVAEYTVDQDDARLRKSGLFVRELTTADRWDAKRRWAAWQRLSSVTPHENMEG